MKNYFLILLIALLGFACGSNCEDDELTAAHNKVDDARDEYFADQTNSAKCQAYLESLEDLIDVLKRCDEDPSEVESYQNTLDAARDDCN